ncbi:MAG: hypothetical protein ACJATI_000602 [Halioglobus sp.]|jgi:hypothetical protein
MKNIFYTFLSMLFAFSVSAQLINDGASIIVEDGATLFIEGSLQNNLTGSIDIQGTGIIEVEGDVTIAPTSTVTMSNTAKLILSGANASNITSGGATFTNVEMDKTANNVSLLDEMRIETDLNFVGDNNKIMLGDNNLVFAPSATITSADDNEYIIADGNANTGVVSKELSADEVFVFEIGDATNYTPLDADISGTGYSSATVDVNVVPMDQPNIPAEATDYISRYWNVDQSGVTDYSADLTGTYVAGDLTGTAADTKGAHYGADWTYTAAAAGVNLVLGTVAESGDFTGTNAFGKLNMKVLLQGAYVGGNNKTTLNTSGILEANALVSPYGDGSTVASGFFAANTDISDWIEVELRDAITPSTVLSTRSAFLKADGSIVGLDGSSLPLLANPNSTTGHIVLNHRNHLSIRTGTALDMDPLSQTDMSSLANVYTNGALSNTAMNEVTAGVFAMWAGNANGNTNIRYSGPANDNNVLLNTILGGNKSGLISNTYSDGDFNMNGTVRYSGPANDNNVLLNGVLGGNKSGLINRHI